MTAIIDIHGREILDSRGNPTVEVDVLLEDLEFIAGVAIQPNFTDAQHVRFVEKLRNQGHHFTG